MYSFRIQENLDQKKLQTLFTLWQFMTSNMQTSPAMTPNMWTLPVMTSNMRTSPDISPNVELMPVMTVCSYSYHFTYAFQSESSLYICINFQEILAWNRHDLWILSHCNGIRTQNHLVRKQTLNHLARLAYKWLWVVVVGSNPVSVARYDC